MLQIDEPNAEFQWFNGQKWLSCEGVPSWNIGTKYCIKPKEWYEDPDMIGKPVWVRDQETDSWKIRIFKDYKAHRFFTEANIIKTSIGWNYAKPVKPEDLYQEAKMINIEDGR